MQLLHLYFKTFQQSSGQSGVGGPWDRGLTHSNIYYPAPNFIKRDTIGTKGQIPVNSNFPEFNQSHTYSKQNYSKSFLEQDKTKQ